MKKYSLLIALSVLASQMQCGNPFFMDLRHYSNGNVYNVNPVPKEKQINLSQNVLVQIEHLPLEKQLGTLALLGMLHLSNFKEVLKAAIKAGQSDIQ